MHGALKLKQNSRLYRLSADLSFLPLFLRYFHRSSYRSCNKTTINNKSTTACTVLYCLVLYYSVQSIVLYTCSCSVFQWHRHCHPWRPRVPSTAPLSNVVSELVSRPGIHCLSRQCAQHILVSFLLWAFVFINALPSQVKSSRAEPSPQQSPSPKGRSGLGEEPARRHQIGRLLTNSLPPNLDGLGFGSSY